jgi:hypothetical protein
MLIEISWATPGYYSYTPNWWADWSTGRGDRAWHAQVTLLGLSLSIRVYERMA